MDRLNLSSPDHTNISSSPYPFSFSWGSRAAGPAAILSLCFLVGFPGNLAVIILKPNWQNLSKSTRSLMMNLALSDLLCLGTVPFWIYDVLVNWTLGTVTCKIVGFLTHCSVYCSVLTVTALSVQRYVQVIHQQRCLRFKKRLQVWLWLSSVVLSTPALVFRREMKYQQHASCDVIYTSSEQQVAVLLSECVVGFSSFIITGCAYFFLNRKLNQAVFFNNVSTSRLVTSIIVTCFVLWMPYIVFNLVSVWGVLVNNLRIVRFYGLGFDIFGSITFLNSSINPILYAFALGICLNNPNLGNSNSRELTSAADV